ncbi:MAG: hypothetical protein HY744_03930 [Deltaproteobacteria bacterium]|nr:hypothetical protein [Deltaproteobacteria bacterium]
MTRRTHLAARLLAAALAGAVVGGASRGRAADPVLGADWNDDDADGVADARQAFVPPSAELLRLDLPRHAARIELPPGAPVRVLADGRPLASGRLVPPGTARLELQATGSGPATVRVGGRTTSVSALSVWAVDGSGQAVDLTASHASLERTVPRDDGNAAGGAGADPDALRYVLAGEPGALPEALAIRSLSAAGELLGELSRVPLLPAPCPAPVPASQICVGSAPIRAVADPVDAQHPLVASRSVLAELGGALVLLGPQGRELQAIRVGGPRRSALGPIRRYRATMRLLLVRLAPGGAVPLGGDEPGAIALARAEIARANALWGACGVSFGPPAEAAVQIVAPPPAHLLVLGCGDGAPASGGLVRFRAGERPIQAWVPAGALPQEAARLVAAAVRRAGLAALVSDNPRSSAGAHGSTDISVRRSGGELVAIEPPAHGPLSSDESMGVCIGHVNLDDGLDHFGDIDAVVGTVEERTLIRAYDDGDPRTIDVLVLPGFSRGGRIGESFIGADRGALRNVVLVDRAGLHAGRASFTVPHELGHVLLDDPGHPDDFGRDTPTQLMDADAADPTAFGPRRLSVAECERALRQSGPGAALVLLRSWPLGPLARR